MITIRQKSNMDYIEDRKLKIKLLTIARQILRKPESDLFICSAIGVAESSSGLRMCYSEQAIVRAAEQLRDYIMSAIYPWAYYSTWVSQTHPGLYHGWRDVYFRKGRLAWIDWMIACYEEDIANYKGTP